MIPIFAKKTAKKKVFFVIFLTLLTKESASFRKRKTGKEESKEKRELMRRSFDEFEMRGRERGRKRE